MSVEQDQQGNASKWTLWSLGTVVEDLPWGSDEIRVTPHERLTLQNGPMGQQKENYVASMASSSGEVKSQNLVSDDVITAKWCPDGDNHLFTAPMVRKNETVKIYKYADTQEYYWTTIFRSPDFRRLERIILGAGNLSQPGRPLSLETIYYLDIDTLNKKITLSTNTSDGEQFAYQLYLDAGQNTAGIRDNVGNNAGIDSANNNVYMVDVSGGIIETRDGHPRIYGPKGILLETPGQVVVKGDTEFKDNVIVRGSTTSVGKLTLNSGMAMNSGNGGSGGPAVFDGDITFKRTFRVEGTSDFYGHATFHAGTSGT